MKYMRGNYFPSDGNSNMSAVLTMILSTPANGEGDRFTMTVRTLFNTTVL